MFFLLVVIYCALVSRASSQNGSTVKTPPYPTTCPNSFLEANATGSASIGSHSLNEPFIWVYSVSENTSTGSFGNLWLGLPPGVNLSNIPDDYGLCTIQLTLPPNTIERGEMDEGSCEQTLDPTCAAALTTAAKYPVERLLEKIVNIPNMYQFCEKVIPAVEAATKDADCAPYFYNQDFSDSNNNSIELIGEGLCINEAYPNMAFTSFENIFPGDVPVPISNSNAFYNYDSAYRDVKTILTVFVPPPTDMTFITLAYINCVHITNTSSGSRVAPTLPFPTAVTFSDGIPLGDVPYFFIGLPFSVSIILGMLYLVRKRKRLLRLVALLFAGEETNEKGIMIDGHDVSEAAADGGRSGRSGMAELKDQVIEEMQGADGGRSGRAELKGQAIVEMQGTDVQNMLHGDDQPLELGSGLKAVPGASA